MSADAADDPGSLAALFAQLGDPGETLRDALILAAQKMERDGMASEVIASAMLAAATPQQSICRRSRKPSAICGAKWMRRPTPRSDREP